LKDGAIDQDDHSEFMNKIFSADGYIEDVASWIEEIYE